jgi:cytochrome c oxidase cbb3-type subunit III
MSQFESGFWDLYIGVISVVSIVACALFLRSQTKGRVAADQKMGHTWDEDLAEYNNPLPGWWRWMFYITIVFALVYLVLYPGLGSWKGTLGWTQVSQFEDEIAKADLKYGPLYDKFSRTEVAELAKNPDALAIGQKLFLNNCAQCHASDGGGSRGFPNLTDLDWLWGGTPDAIRTSITEGRTGTMPAWGAALGDQGVKDVAHYVRSLSGMVHDSVRAAKGKDHFQRMCIACHGAEGKGNTAMGAPNLTDKVWLHGGSEEAIIDTITRGRVDQMPAHKEKLSQAKIHLLTAYVYSISSSGVVVPHRK